MSWLREWLPGPPMPLVRVLIYAGAAVLVTGAVRPDFYKSQGAPLLEGYSLLSLDLAMSRAFCDTPSAINPLVSVATVASIQTELLDVPAGQIAAERAGGLQKFCESATAPRINNENSLMWLDSWLWRLWPELSINQLGQLLHGIRVAMIVATFTLLLASGTGVIVAAISWFWALTLLQQLDGYVHHGYPFMLTMLLLTVSAYPVVSRRGWTQSLRGAATVAAITGVWTGFATNMRTSHLPIYVSLIILLFASSELSYRQPARLQRMAIAAALFVVGFFAFQYLAITRHLPGDVDVLARHTIFHSVVIGLGVPESDLSRREALTWADGAANAAALKVDPDAAYLSKRYEAALFKYYSGLWSQHPREMMQAYWMKARTAGKHMLEILRTREGRTGQLLRLGLAPMDLLPNGVWMAFMYVAIAAGGMWRCWRDQSALGALLAFMAVPAILLQLEATLIMSHYVINYQAYLAFIVIFISVVLPAVLVGLVWDSERMQSSVRGPLTLLFGFRTDQTPLRLAAFGVALAILFVTGRINTSPPPVPVSDGHAVAAIELAMTRAFCDAKSAYPPRYRVPHYLRDHPADDAKPLRQVAAEMAGSVDAYCADISEPFLNNENSLTVIQSWLLRAEPGLSLDGLGRRLHQVRVAIVLFFAAVCLTSGLSVVMSTAVVLAGVAILGALNGDQHTAYPFLFPSVLLAASIYTLAWPGLRDGRWPWLIPACAISGAVAGLGVNMRTSYWPVFLSMLVVVLVFAVREWQLQLGVTLARVAVVTAVFGVSLWAAQYWWIDRYLPETFPYNSAHHPVAHPLVLALANPENPLSRREGIEWLDAAGLTLAKKIDPDVSYLGPTYGPALFRYYGQLWTTYPGEMAQLYLVKFNSAGVSIIDAMRYGGMPNRGVRMLLRPFAYVRSGFLLLGACVTAVLLAYVACSPRSGSFALLVALLATAATLVLVESAIIMPAYTPRYHGYLMLFFPMMSIFALQLFAHVAVGRIGRTPFTHQPTGQPLQ